MADAELELEQVEQLLEETPEAETKEGAVTEQPRDETGKFAPKETPKPEAKAEPEKVEPDKVEAEDEKGVVPSWRLKEVSDARRAAEAERDTFKAQIAQMQARLAGLEKPPEQKTENIDPLLDPDGFTRKLTTEFSQRLAEVQLNNNLALAHVRHGEKFEKAYSALIAQAQAGNRQLVPHLTSQANPGEAIVKWYSDQETLREVGGDPASYKTKLLEEALKDPTYLAKAIEAAKASAGQQRSNNITKLPPSLSRTTGSSNDHDDEVMGVEALLAR